MNRTVLTELAVPVGLKAAALALAALSLLQACTDASQEPSGTPPASPTVTAAASTGDPALDEIIGGVTSGNADLVASRLSTALVPCTKQIVGKLPSLSCEEGEDEGAIHEVVVTGGCQPTFVSQAGALQLLRQFLGQSLRIYAVTRENSAYRVIFGGVQLTGAFVLLVENGRVRSFGGSCGQSPSETAGANAIFLLPPQF